MADRRDLDDRIGQGRGACPLRERLWSRLILALYRVGRQVEALRAYERYRRTLEEVLGVRPSPYLRAIHAALVRQDSRAAGPVESGRGAVLAFRSSPFPRLARRTGRATFTASGSPRVHARGQAIVPCVTLVHGEGMAAPR
ncbi:MAG: BTAD domain-containing putative transcriptional regulator [Acidimicrobiales bacterium]